MADSEWTSDEIDLWEAASDDWDEANIKALTDNDEIEQEQRGRDFGLVRELNETNQRQ